VIALATSSDLPDGTEDDRALAELLGAPFVVWSDPAADWSSFTRVVLRSTWDYVGRRDAFLAWCDHLGDRLVNGPDMVRWNIDKRYLGQLEATGIPVVPTTFLGLGQQLPDFADEIVVKPAVSASAQDTGRFVAAEAAPARALLAHIYDSGREALLQPYLPSVDHRGETTLVYFGGAFSHAATKGPRLVRAAGSGAARTPASVIASRIPEDDERALGKSVVDWIAGHFGRWPAYARVDVLRAADGRALLLEVEVAEPALYLRQDAGAARRLAAVLRALG
jgi:hypothetical protein